MSSPLASEFERAAKTAKDAGTLLFLAGALVAVIAVLNGAWHLFAVMAFGAVIGLAFRVEGAVREEVARHAPSGSEGRLRARPAAED
jgi:hypothetical protein